MSSDERDPKIELEPELESSDGKQDKPARYISLYTSISI